MNKDKEYLHEALDRAHIASCHFQMALGEHEIIEKYEDIKTAYEIAVEKVEELYQLIGQKL